jgi:TonB family protein
MDRLGKKCFVASCGMHVVLVLIVLFGAAFFTPEKKAPPVDNLTMIPSKLIDDALSGGGGNPKIAPSDAKIKGDTLDPVPVQPTPVKPQVEPPKPKVTETPPTKPPEPKKIETPKPTAIKIPKDPPKTTTKPKDAPIELTPVSKSKTDREKARKEAEAKARAAEQAAQDRMAKALGNVRKNLKQGFTSGTAVEVSGPGGEAYASYRSFVFAAYDNAWQVQPDIADDDAVVVARIVIHRTGRIISATISERSGMSALDKSVQRALDGVKSLPPFPESTRDQERIFVIEFSLKAKRLIG